MKAACLLTTSMYSLVASANGGIGAAGEVVGGDGTTRAGFMGSGGVSVVSIETKSWASGVGTGFGTGVKVDPGAGVDIGSGIGVDSGHWAGAGDSY